MGLWWAARSARYVAWAATTVAFCGTAIIVLSLYSRAAAYPVIRSALALVDTLVAVTSPDADSVRVHRTERDGGLLVMRRMDSLQIPPGTPLRMEPGGTHLMLEGLARPFRPGDTVEVRLQFRLNGARTLRLPVRAYADVAAP